MFLYTVIEAVVGIVAGLLIAICVKRSADVRYGTLDKVGIATNILLIPVYACLSPFYLFLGMISEPNAEGILLIPSMAVCLTIASAAMVSGLGLGCSVALRKRGRSGLSFAVQFAGFVGVALTVLLYTIFLDSLVAPLN